MLRSLFASLTLTVPVRRLGSSCSHHGIPSIAFFNKAAADNFSQTRRFLQTSQCRRDLMEFFDDKKNWGESSVRSGRSWRVDELRIKSNSDLHKLWYILLKERNMLMTMEHECKVECELFPAPERLDKVEESMKNLETVVKERNRAFHLLETGETGERPGIEEENFLGLEEYRQFEEYTVPKHENKDYLIAKRDEPQSSLKEKSWFLRRWKEKQRRERRKTLKKNQKKKAPKRELVIPLITKNEWRVDGKAEKKLWKPQDGDENENSEQNGATEATERKTKNSKVSKKMRHQYEVIQLLQRFPNLDVEALKEKYPDVNVDKYVERFWKEVYQGNINDNPRFWGHS